MKSGGTQPAPFFVTSGTLGLDAVSYVERQCDRDLLRLLLQGQFCYVLTSRQMGKSSLMVRTAKKLQEQGCAVVVWDLTAIGQNLDPEQWYDGLCVRMGQQLQLEEKLEAFWMSKPQLSPLQRLIVTLQEVVMTGGQPLVVFLDEIDMVRSLPFPTDEFFAAIRECCNRRAQDAVFQRITFCLLGVATPSDLIQDTRLTPFNIGHRLELNDFTEAEAAPLARGLQREDASLEQARSLLSRILYWTNGHPYLTQRLCEAVADTNHPRLDPVQIIDPLCEDGFFSSRARERDDNLLFVRERLLRSEVDPTKLLQQYEAVLRGRPVRDDESNPVVSVLRLAGIVRAQDGWLQIRNRIYERVFSRSWVRDQMPDAEQRRIAAAFRKGVIRTTAIATVVVAFMTVMVIIAANQAQKAQNALQESLKSRAASLLSQAEAQSVSGLAGQRFRSLEAVGQAGPHYTNQAALRDQAIASLALVDLQEQPSPVVVPKQATALGLNRGLTHYAWAEDRGTIHVFKTGEATAIDTIPPIGMEVSWLCLSPDGRFVAAQYEGSNSYRFSLWDSSIGKEIVRLTNHILQSAVDFAPNSKMAAAGIPHEGVYVFSLPEGTRIAHLQAQEPTSITRNPLCVRCSPVAGQLAESGSNSLSLTLWDVSSGSSTNLYHGAPVVAMDWSPDGQQLATATTSGAIYLWDLHWARRRILDQAHSDRIVDLAFRPSGHVLATLALDRTLKLWIPATGRQVTQFLPSEPSGRLYFNEGGQQLGLATLQAKAQFWQVRGSEEYQVFRPLEEVLASITSIGFGVDGRLLFVANNIGVFLWDTPTARALPSLDVKSVRSAVIDPIHGDLIVSSPNNLWRFPKNPNEKGGVFGEGQTLPLGVGLGRCALSANGRRAATISGQRVLVFEPDNPSKPQCLRPLGHYQELDLSPDGQWLATWSSQENQVRVWAVEKKDGLSEAVHSMPGSGYFVFSPDGSHLVTCWDRVYRFWKVGSWVAEDSFIERPSFGDPAGPLAFSPVSGSGLALIAVADMPATIKLYKVQTAPAFELGLLATLKSPDRTPLIALAFNRDATRLAAATADQTVQLWDLASIGKALATLHLGDDLSMFPLRSGNSIHP